MTYRKQLLITTAVLAIAPFAAQAAPVSWTGATSNAWNTKGNWSSGAVPGATSGVTIGVTKNSPVQLNVNSSLNGSGGSLTIGSAEELDINSGFTLTMGANAVTLNGALAGPGPLSTTGTNSLFGTLNGLTISGAGGAWNLTGNSTLKGAIGFATGSSQTFNAGAFTLNLDTATLTRTGTGTAAFTIGAGGVLNNANNASSITTAGTVTLSGGSITNTSGQGGTTAGLFTIANPVSGTGNISGNVALTGTGLTATGGNLTLNGTGIVLGAGLAAASTSGNTLDLQGNISVPGAMTMTPGSGLIDFDNVTISGGGTGSINTSATTTAGTFDVINPTQLNGLSFNTGSAATLKIDKSLSIDATSSVTAKTVTLNGTAINGPGSFTATTITSTGASTLNAPFTANLSVSSGSLDIKQSGTSSGTSTVGGGTTLNVDSGATWTGGSATNSGTINLNSGGSWSGSATNNATGIINLNTGGKWTLPNSLTALTNNGAVNLNGGTLQGPTGFFNTAYIRNNSPTVAADSTLAGNFTWGTSFTIDTGAHTLNLDTSILSTVTGGAPPFTIDAGGTLNNANGASSIGGGGTVTLNGGSITTTAGSLKISDAISGYGLVSGNVDIAGSLTAAGAGKTLTVDGGAGSPLQLGNSSGSGTSMGTSGGATLDLKGNLSLIEPATASPGTGTIQFDGANFTNAFSSSPVSINNSGLATAGTFDVVGAKSSTLNNVAFSAGNGANLKVDAPLTVTGGGSVNAPTTTIGGTGTLSLLNTTGAATGALTGNNLSMQNGALLVVGAPGHNGITLSGNFDFLQTNQLTGWTNNGTAGLGPDLTMIGGSSATPVTLEAGGANEGYNPAAFVQNFALDMLTIGKGSTTPPAYVDLVDQHSNTTGAGTEILYLDALEGLPSTGPIGTLNLDGITAYVMGHGFLFNGLYIAPDGTEVNIIGANTTPEPATLALFGTGLLGLGLVRRRRRS